MGSIGYGKQNVGGFVGCLTGSSIIFNCYSQGDVKAKQMAGGFAEITNCYTSTVVLSSGFMLGAFCGRIDSHDVIGNNNAASTEIHSNLYSTYKSPSIDIVDLSISEITAKYTPEYMGFTEENGWKVINGELKLAWESVDGVNWEVQNYVSLQVGVNSSSFDISFKLDGLNDILQKSIDDENCLNLIDDLLYQISAKQTEFGAVSNKLESVLEEISIQYDNLVSTRSTIQDADIAEVLSEPDFATSGCDFDVNRKSDNCYSIAITVKFATTLALRVGERNVIPASVPL